MKADLKKIMRDAEAKVKLNLPQACRELIELRDTGVLPAGIVREVAHDLKAISIIDALKISQSMVTNQALEHVARSKA